MKSMKFLLGNSISNLISVLLFGANRNAIPLILFNSDSVFGIGNKSKMFKYALIHLSPLDIWIVAQGHMRNPPNYFCQTMTK